MNFYQAQDSAKKKTTILVLVYILVLFALTVLSSLALLFLLPIAIGQTIPEFTLQSIFSEQHLPMLLGVTAFIVGGAIISSYIKSRQLSQGGAIVAASLGGVKICSNTRNLHERKVLNVVEEMAIASGMPVPEVYLLKHESGINAFAAGQTPMDAVIGVTQGCIDKLSRAQLQGVVGHEFSHILNGDMRLNLRIIMLLHGIEFVSLLGQILTSSQRRNHYGRARRGKSNGAIVIAGIALLIIGWLGVFFGNLIKAAVSRQREFLADASAVQFTRDPSNIADALKVIGHGVGGSRTKNNDLHEVAHMFFVQSFSTYFAMLFATHPPIEQRIQAIEPHWDGAFLPPLPPPAPPPEAGNNASKPPDFMSGLPEPLALLMAAGVMLDQLNTKQQRHLTRLVEQSKDPMEAMALILAIFIVGQKEYPLEQSSTQPAWLELLEAQAQQGLSKLVRDKLALFEHDQLNQQSQLLLPLIELSLPALKQMSVQQYGEFKALMSKVILLDGHESVFEQSIYLLVTRYLDVHYGLTDRNKIKFRRASEVAMELNVLFSCLVCYGHDEGGAYTRIKEGAYQAAMDHLGLGKLKRMDFDYAQQDRIEVERMFNHAVEKLVYCSPSLKQKIVEAISITIEFDGVVNDIEKELALAIAATMDAPIPRLKL